MPRPLPPSGRHLDLRVPRHSCSLAQIHAVRSAWHSNHFWQKAMLKAVHAAISSGVCIVPAEPAEPAMPAMPAEPADDPPLPADDSALPAAPRLPPPSESSSLPQATVIPKTASTANVPTRPMVHLPVLLVAPRRGQSTITVEHAHRAPPGGNPDLGAECPRTSAQCDFGVVEIAVRFFDYARAPASLGPRTPTASRS